MMNKLLALTVALLFTACVADESTDPTDPTEPGTAELSKADTAAGAPAAAADDHAYSVCDHIIETDGPCSVACDPEKLGEYLPEHTCVLIVCHLDDGSTYQTGGCTP